VGTVSQALQQALQVITEAAAGQQGLEGGAVYVGTAGVALVYLKLWEKLAAGAQLPGGLQHAITAEGARLKVLELCSDAAPLISRRRVRGPAVGLLAAPVRPACGPAWRQALTCCRAPS
jgi:hypothetical protein